MKNRYRFKSITLFKINLYLSCYTRSAILIGGLTVLLRTAHIFLRKILICFYRYHKKQSIIVIADNYKMLISIKKYI